MSFLLDPPLLVASGAAIERAGLRGAAGRRAEWLVAAVFVGASGRLYLDRRVPGFGPVLRLFGARSGRDFMLNSGVLRLDPDRAGVPSHLVAAALFALYPRWVRLGRHLAAGR